jgi:transcriptional regulator with XRE-family HTH domain
MTDPEPATGPVSSDADSLFPRTPGERLRAAREADGLSLADIAARTRVPIRHLQAIESGDYSGLPTPTYAIGFAKAYARAVGLDEVAIARDVRGQTAAAARARQEYQPYEIDDPARIPPRGLALAAGAIGLIVLIGALIWFGTDWFRGKPQSAPTTIASSAAPMPAPIQTAPVPSINGSGQVTLTALARVWVRVHDGSGKTLFENTMNPGDHYNVPGDADRPVVSVGRPDKLQVTLNGAQLPPLGSGVKPVKDAPVDAATLSAERHVAPRTTPAAVLSPAPTTAPTPMPTASPSPHHTATPHAHHTPRPEPTPLKLDLKPTPPPVPAPTGIY